MSDEPAIEVDDSSTVVLTTYDVGDLHVELCVAKTALDMAAEVDYAVIASPTLIIRKVQRGT
jgi:hypothetical protein